MISSALTVGHCELRVGTRNRWVLLAASILLLFALVLGFLGSGPTGTIKTDPLVVTVASLATLSVYLVPLIALLLSYDAIAGEIDRGTLQLVLATPISRSSYLLGKFSGHLTIIAIAIAVGYGLAGGTVYLLSGGNAQGVLDLVRLIATSIALGAAFIAVGYVISTNVQQTGTAAACAIGAWLLMVVLYDLALLSALIADGDGFFAKDIFPYMLVANPADAFRLYNISSLDSGATSHGLSGFAEALPFPAEIGLLSLCLWAVLGFAAALFSFRRAEP